MPGVRFSAAKVQCIIADNPPHSAEPGIWPTGQVDLTICSMHMDNWKRWVQREHDQRLAKRSKLWWAGKRPSA